ncbi:nitrate regulatory gene2 protein-like [Ipomoea triloba]|uniref:nitrate regulatory gene2 protein-like n=1 Tax=Ipomoea triloba TaxID=35885 RepID=UPI00125D63B5|nr:nitrate regulatory gene2 protein-like [Ipomoea triloba]
MGCGQSRLDNEESVSRCKERRNLMKEAVSVRNAFASVHSAYATALKNTGAALNDYALGEAPSAQPPLLVNQPSSELPPPPPLPNFSPMPPLQRAMTTPELSKPPGKMAGDKETTEAALPPPPPESKGEAWDYFFMVENMAGGSLEEEEEDDGSVEETEEENGGVEELKGVEQTPAKEKHFIMHSNTVAPEIRKSGAAVGNIEDFFKVLGEIDDRFLKASECAQEVSTMLEATRLHYHSNLPQNPGHIDHAARVMRVITWNKSINGLPNGNGDDTKDELGSDEYEETHASVLDKLLAWEKKLYEEVKAGELIKHEYQKKVRLLNKLKKGNNATTSEALEKTKAGLSHLHTRYVVDMQSLDSTLTEVNTIRDKQLYPILVDLVHGMGRMWESMCTHHENQLNIATHLKSIDISITTPIETSKHHLEHTIQLAKVVADWGQQFDHLVNNQKSYIQALNAWLKLNLIPMESSSLKDKTISSPPTPPPPIQPLLQAWHELLEKLPDEPAKSAIASFEAVIRTIIAHQEEEVRLKEKCEETRKEYVRKRQAFEEWYQKYTQRRTMEAITETTNPKDPIAEKQFAVLSLKKRLEDEIEAHQKQCIQVREKSLGNLKVRLPELFHSITDYSHACLDAYQRLGLLVVQQSQNRPA